jgi:NitT/TauT family transport system permease protein
VGVLWWQSLGKQVFFSNFTVIVIGLIVENLIFRNVEAVTARRWGMQS